MEHVKLKVQNITKVFGKNPSKAIDLLQKGKTKKEILEETGMTIGVNQANFEIKSGEIFVIMGLSGSGKSTLVRMFNRLVEPTSGSLILDGDDVVKMNKDELRDMRRKKMSMVFQNLALFPHRTVLDNTEYGLHQKTNVKRKQKKRLN
jgi:glycine betaine/proline transport system ATP-binding protein